MPVRQPTASLDETAASRLAHLRAQGLRREMVTTAPAQGVQVERGGRTLVSFSGNDYLGLSRHPAIVAAAREALERYGAGAGASRLISGSHPYYETLEALLAQMKGTQAACVFGSGTLANIGTIPALVGAGDLILADKSVHACMLDSARLSGATFMRFAHNNMDHCRLLLEENRRDFQRCLILTETVFSMDGDRAPLVPLSELACLHDAWLMADDAHGLGVVPQESPADIHMGTLSKAAGGYGGYVCASRPVIDLLKGTSRTLLFSTALPPATVAAAAAALEIIRADSELCARPLAHARLFTSLLGREEAQSPIVPVIVGEPERALAASAMLEANGFYVAAIRPPTVALGSARLRFAFSALHEGGQIERVAALLKAHGYA